MPSTAASQTRQSSLQQPHRLDGSFYTLQQPYRLDGSVYSSLTDQMGQSTATSQIRWVILQQPHRLDGSFYSSLTDQMGQSTAASQTRWASLQQPHRLDGPVYSNLTDQMAPSTAQDRMRQCCQYHTKENSLKCSVFFIGHRILPAKRYHSVDILNFHKKGEN